MKNILVMDNFTYQKRHSEFLKLMDDILGGENKIVYTEYEDGIIRKVRNYKFIGSILQHILYWIKSFGYAIRIIRFDSDTIYCVNPIVGFFLGLFNKKKKIVLGGFLFEPKRNKIYYNIRKSITKLSLKRIETVVVYGSREVEYYRKIFKLDKFKFIKYGIDFEEPCKYLNQDLPNRYIFSGGGSNRDYVTLVNAYNLLKDKPLLVIATQPWRLEYLDVTQIKNLDDVVLENFGDVMKNSLFLVLSLKDQVVSTGHMVMFQAMSLEVPILVNDITAIRDYVDEKSVIFYESGDVEELSKLISILSDDISHFHGKTKFAKKIYDEKLTYKSFIERFLSL